MKTDREILQRLGRVGPIFFERFPTLHPVQREAIPPILGGQDVLLCSATASGKTEAIFAPLAVRLGVSRRQAIRLLAVCPTRALVNDLYVRLEAPFSRLGWRIGRQTSDHGDKQAAPDLLITTPESLDSMLVRDATRDKGKLLGHLLADVCALFLDEIHLYEGSARGDQVAWLVARLHRLREYAHRRGWVGDEGLQVCGASATVSDPVGLASRLFRTQPTVVQVPGNREIDVLGDVGWLDLHCIGEPEQIRAYLGRANGPTDLASIESHVWRAIANGLSDGCRKALVFVPTRSLCDRLSAFLASELRKRRDVYVGAHHGSLAREFRERAERAFAQTRDAVLVATTTLEIGIDIGDVDVVVLVGPPPDVGGLLQRIGRSGRRAGRTRVVPIARDEIEAHAFGSLLDAATHGRLDESVGGHRWSVFVQQAASYVAQAHPSGRLREELLALAKSVWPAEENRDRAVRILDGLIAQGVLVSDGNRLFLGEAFSNAVEGMGTGLHSNIGAGRGGVPVVDASTGEVVAYVSQVPEGAERVALAGEHWEVVNETGEFLLRPAEGTARAEAFRYSARRGPVKGAFASHVQRGFGFAPQEAPVLSSRGDWLWFHFGGSAFQVALQVLSPGLARVKGLEGLAVRGALDLPSLRRLCEDHQSMCTTLEVRADLLESALASGPYQSYLPPNIRASVTLELLDPLRFSRWVASRVVWTLDALDPRTDRLINALT